MPGALQDITLRSMFRSEVDIAAFTRGFNDLPQSIRNRMKYCMWKDLELTVRGDDVFHTIHDEFVNVYNILNGHKVTMATRYALLTTRRSNMWYKKNMFFPTDRFHVVTMSVGVPLSFPTENGSIQIRLESCCVKCALELLPQDRRSTYNVVFYHEEHVIDNSLYEHTIHNIIYYGNNFCSNCRTQPLFVIMCPSECQSKYHNAILWEDWDEDVQRAYIPLNDCSEVIDALNERRHPEVTSYDEYRTQLGVRRRSHYVAEHARQSNGPNGIRL